MSSYFDEEFGRIGFSAFCRLSNFHFFRVLLKMPFSLDHVIIAFLGSLVIKGPSFALRYFFFRGACLFSISLIVESKMLKFCFIAEFELSSFPTISLNEILLSLL